MEDPLWGWGGRLGDRAAEESLGMIQKEGKSLPTACTLSWCGFAVSFAPSASTLV